MKLRIWLKDLRNQNKLTQEDIAKQSGISRSYYTHIEQGTKTPTVDVAKSIASTLNFDWVIFFNYSSSL